MKKFNLITFDITGTLLTFNKSVGEIYSDAAKCFGITVEPTKITASFNKYMSEMSHQHPNYGLYSGIGWHKWWKMVVLKSFKDNGENSKNIEQLSDFLIDSFSKKNQWKLVDGSVDILDYLRKKDIHIGVISNYDPRLHKLLDDIGINKYFTFVITSYEAGFMKPDEQIFKEAQKKYTDLGFKFDKNTTVHIGDSFTCDYCGAKNAGWRAALIDPSLKKDSTESSFTVFNDLNELNEQFLKTC